MTSIDRLAKTNIDLEVFRIINDRTAVCFKDTYVKDGCLLVGEFGRGDTVEEAAADYIEKLQGKTIVVNPSSKNRREILFL